MGQLNIGLYFSLLHCKVGVFNGKVTGY